MAFKMKGFPYNKPAHKKVDNNVEVEVNNPEPYMTIDGYSLTKPQYEKYQQLEKVGKGNKYLYSVGTKDPDSIVNK